MATYSVTVSGTSFAVSIAGVGQQGAPGANWQGAWATTTDYAVNDVVSNDGSAYICILAHTSASTDEPGVGVNTATYWAILAQGGADGTDGDGFTGGSYNAGTGVVTFTSDDGLGFSTGDLRGADGTGFTGGSYNAGTGVVTFTSDDDLGFSTGDLRGADGTDGLGFTWEGSWATSTAFAVNDVVENDGSSYICILGHTSSASDEPGVGVNTATYWELVAQKGADGAGTGTVTSIDITGGAGITSTGGPVTSSGAITVALDSATQTSLGLADTALQPAAIGTTVQAYSAVLAATTASFTTADESKLAGIEAGATADQTGAEIKVAYEAEVDTNAYTDAEKSKLAGIEAAADVTDTANVTAAGALMDSEVSSLSGIKTLTVPDSTTISTFGASLVDDADAAAARATLGLGTAATTASTDYATAAQGSTADTALQPTGTVTLTGGFDSDEEALGTITSGTVTPEVDGANKENFKSLTNNGAFTLAPPSTSSACCIRIHVINGASAGAITTTGFDKVFDPDTYSTTNAKEYFFYIDHNATRDVLTIREIV